MQTRANCGLLAAALAIYVGAAGTADAQQSEDFRAEAREALTVGARPAYAADLDRPASEEETGEEQAAPRATRWAGGGYRGVSSFFNVREANSNVAQGEWEFEFTLKWFTSSGESDEFEAAQSIKYGFADRFHVELEVEQPDLGEGGGHGAGDTKLTLFYQFLEETDVLPALGAFAQARFPSGDDSSGVDGTLSAMATKTFGERFRFHFQGFIMTANGSIGESEAERRGFQWGLGPGFDFQIDEDTLVALNYWHRVNDEEHARNQNILELGLVREIGHIGPTEHELKLAVDIGLDGVESTPNFGAKLQWGIEW